MAALGDRGPFLGGTDLTVPAAGGVPIAATAWGGATAAGPTPVVLLHGLSQQRRFWGPVARRLGTDSPSPPPLAALDLRAHGDSGGGLDAAYDITTCADDVLAVLDALGWDRAVTVGHSWGAAVSLAVAARAPGRITAAVAIDGGIVGPGELGPREEVRERLTPPRLGIAEADLVPLLRSGSLADWWTDEVEAALLPTFEVGDDGLVRTRIGFDRHLAVLDGLLDHDHEAVLSAVECPAWVVSCEPARSERERAPQRASHVQSEAAVHNGDAHRGQEWQRAREAGVQRAARLLARPRLQHWFGAVHDVPLQWPALVAGLIRSAVEEEGAGP